MNKNKKLVLILFAMSLLLTAGCGLGNNDYSLRDIFDEEDAREEKQPGIEWETVLEDSLYESQDPEPCPEAEISQVENNYYYMQLSEENQLLYRQILYGIENHLHDFPIDASDADTPHTIYYAVLLDYPDLFWMNGESTVWEINNGESYELELTCTMEEEEIESYRQQIDINVNEFLSIIPEDADTYTKVKTAYEWIIGHTDYQSDSLNNQNILSVLVQNESVCAGYAKAFQYLMNRLAIPCIYVEGYADGEPHAWNIVNIDGVYTEVDCTWGEPNFEDAEMHENESIIYDYLCLTTEELSRTHTPDPPYTYPECVDTSYDYYRLYGTYFDDYDEDALIQACRNTVDVGGTHTFLKFASEDTFWQAVDAIDGDVLDDVAYEKMEWDGLEEYTYTYYCDEDLWIIKLFW